MATRKKKARQPPVDVKEQCVAAAHAVIASRGVEQLSLREVARKLGISHQAPYKHYPSRDHLLAEVIRRSFTRFTEHLEARPRSGDYERDLQALGRAYLEFAVANPLEYRLMFATPWPPGADHEALAAEARRSFDVLRSVLARRRPAPAAHRNDLDALFVWSSMHGLASILQSSLVERLRLVPRVDEAVQSIMAHVRRALNS